MKWKNWNLNIKEYVTFQIPGPIEGKDRIPMPGGQWGGDHILSSHHKLWQNKGRVDLTFCYYNTNWVWIFEFPPNLIQIYPLIVDRILVFSYNCNNMMTGNIMCSICWICSKMFYASVLDFFFLFLFFTIFIQQLCHSDRSLWYSSL